MQGVTVIDGGEDVVEIVRQQQGTLAGFGEHFEKPLLRPFGQIGGVFVQQLVGGLRASIKSLFQMPEGFQPEAGQIADVVLLLGELDRQPGR